ncbi:MAG: cytochrome P450 [Pseudomonadales bacterium]
MDTLPEYSLLDDATRECPFRYFQTIRAEQPVYFMPELGVYYVSRYEDVRYVKKNPELFSNDTSKTSSRSSARDIAEEYRSEHGWARVSTLQRTDPPIHGCYRKLIDGAFPVRRIRTMTSYIETIVNDLIDEFIDAGSCEFVSEFSVPLPCTVIADQLGVPRSKLPELKAWSDAMLAPGGGFVDDSAAIDCAKLVVQAQKFFASVIEARRDEPRDDIISDLVQAQFDDGSGAAPRALSMPELQDLLDQLLTGGNETTTSAIGSALLLLLQRPGLADQLRADDKRLRAFIEESLRYETPVLHLWRVATEDTQLGGVDIPKGASLALGYASANRDEAVFDDSETFDVNRPKPGAHLAFGSGPHHCPGAALARQEMFSAFKILLARLHHIELTVPVDELTHAPSIFLRGLTRLPIRFDVLQRERYEPGACVF